MKVPDRNRVSLRASIVMAVLLVFLSGCGPVTSTITAATATPTGIPRPAQVPAPWQLRLNDSLTNNECGTWDCGQDNSGAKRQFSTEGYELSSPASGNCQGTDTKSTDRFSDLYFQATMTIKSGTSDSGDAGLVFRLDNNSSDYIFNFDSSGDWQLSSYLGPTNHETLLGGATSTFFGEGFGASNVLGVLAVGNTFKLYVNGNQIASVTDPNPTIAGRQIAFEVDAGNSRAADVVFRDVQVWAP